MNLASEILDELKRHISNNQLELLTDAKPVSELKFENIKKDDLVIFFTEDMRLYAFVVTDDYTLIKLRPPLSVKVILGDKILLNEYIGLMTYLNNKDICKLVPVSSATFFVGRIIGDSDRIKTKPITKIFHIPADIGSKKS